LPAWLWQRPPRTGQQRWRQALQQLGAAGGRQLLLQGGAQRCHLACTAQGLVGHCAWWLCSSTMEVLGNSQQHQAHAQVG